MHSRVDLDNATATVVAHADGVLRLEWQTAALPPHLVAHNAILSNISEAAAVDEVVPLPMTRGMAAAWLEGVLAQEGSDSLAGLGMRASKLAQVLVVRTACSASSLL